METPVGTSQGAIAGGDGARRKIELRRGTIQMDKDGLRRTAEYSDGSVKNAAMKWKDVRRIAAFQRDVMTSRVLCLALTDSANVIILDETMEGWNGFVAAIPAHVPGAPGEGQWRKAIVNPPAAANWTVLFRAE